MMRSIAVGLSWLSDVPAPITIWAAVWNGYSVHSRTIAPIYLQVNVIGRLLHQHLNGSEERLDEASAETLVYLSELACWIIVECLEDLLVSRIERDQGADIVPVHVP